MLLEQHHARTVSAGERVEAVLTAFRESTVEIHIILLEFELKM